MRKLPGFLGPDVGAEPTGQPPRKVAHQQSISAGEVLPLWDTGRPTRARQGRVARTQRRRPRGKSLVLPADKLPQISAEQRLLLLDTWQKSELPAGDFAAMVGVSKHTLYAWKKRFDTHGPAGLLD